MHRRMVPVVVAVSALVAASCGGGSDDSESAPETSAPDPTILTLDEGAGDETPATTDVPSTSAPDAEPASGALPADTGPELQWIEVATDLRIAPGQLMWTGSFFLIGSHDENGLALLRSTDGVDWRPISNLPGGVDRFGFHAAGESIVAWGVDLPADDPAEEGRFEHRPGLAPEDVQIIASTDGGDTWDELDRLDLTARSASPYLRADSSVYGAATSGDIVFVTVETFAQLDFEQILADNNVDPARIADGRRTDDGMAICLFPVGFDPADEGFEDDEGYEGDEGYEEDEEFDGDEAIPAEEGYGDDEGFEGDEEFEGFETCEGAEGIEGIEQLDITFEQLGLDDADLRAIDTLTLETYRSLDGGPFEAATVDPPIAGDWHPGWLRVLDGEFVAAATNETGDTLILRSADALEWERGDPISAYIEGVTSDGVSLFAQSYSGEGPVFIRSDDGGRTWTDFDVAGAASDEIFALSAGPAGIAVLGAHIPEPSVVEPRPFLIEKDGYGVRITDDNGTILIDLDTGETVLFLEPEEGESEFVIEDENGVTVLDQDTLEPLVTFTWSELEQAFEEAFGERSEPDFFVGWSADGEHWAWQFTADAFGANGGAQFAVGDGAVVAMYQDFESGMPVVRIFTAQVG